MKYAYKFGYKNNVLAFKKKIYISDEKLGWHAHTHHMLSTPLLLLCTFVFCFFLLFAILFICTTVQLARETGQLSVHIKKLHIKIF